MQKANLSAAEGQDVTALTVTILQSLRSAENFDIFFALQESELLQLSM